MGIPNVPYLSQRDNSLFKSSSCYPSSMAMCIQYIMNIEGLTRTAIGVPGNMQLEDFITEISQSKEMKRWAVQKWGSWVKPRLNGLRTFALVEDHIFNDLFNQFGYKSTFRNNLTWENFTNKLEETQLPCPVRGKFPLLLGGGHIVCCVGFDFQNRRIIVNDPYGNMNKRYKDRNGEKVRYSINKHFLNRNKKMFTNIIEKT